MPTLTLQFPCFKYDEADIVEANPAVPTNSVVHVRGLRIFVDNDSDGVINEAKGDQILKEADVRLDNAGVAWTPSTFGVALRNHCAAVINANKPPPVVVVSSILSPFNGMTFNASLQQSEDPETTPGAIVVAGS